MANGPGLRGVQSRWEGGDLVFETLAGVEALRIGADGVVSIAGIAYPTTDGAPTTQLTTNGSGTLSFLPADDGVA